MDPEVAADACSVSRDEGSCHDPDQAKILSIAAVFVILAASSMGVFIPIFGRKLVKGLQPGSNLFLIGKAFAAGIVLALGFVHVLNDGVEKLSNPCLTGTWTKYPWSFWLASMGVALSLALELAAVQFHSFFSGKNSLLALAKGHHQPDHVHGAEQGVVPHGSVNGESVNGHGESVNGHGESVNGVNGGCAHGKMTPSDVEAGGAEKEAAYGTRRHKIIAEVLEIGIIVHSVLVGVGLGTSSSKCTVTSLFIALVFHQFFEGVALGSCLVEASYSLMTTVVMACSFAITTPFGIALGLGIRSSYNDNSHEALAIEGTFNSITAGILIYMATVDLIAHDFFSEKMLGHPKLLWASFVAVLLGMGAMDVLAYWA